MNLYRGVQPPKDHDEPIPEFRPRRSPGPVACTICILLCLAVIAHLVAQGETFYAGLVATWMVLSTTVFVALKIPDALARRRAAKIGNELVAQIMAQR